MKQSKQSELIQSIIEELPELADDLRARDAKGWEVYRKPLTIFDGRDTLQDLFEEILDAIIYTKKYMIESGHGNWRSWHNVYMSLV